MSIRTFGIMIVTFLILASTISILVPSGKMEKPIKFVISICFIFLVLSSLNSIKLNILNIDNKEIETSSNTIYSLTLDMTKEVLENKIIDSLASNDIYLENLEIHANILDDSSISITKVTYKTNNDEKAILIEKVLYENTGCKVIEREKDEKLIIE